VSEDQAEYRVEMGGNAADIRVIAKAIRNWADEIMPQRLPADAIKKLSMEEVPELWRALKDYGTVDPGEIADVLILALDICELSRIDPLEAIHNKMIINMGRTWKFEHGVLQHENK